MFSWGNININWQILNFIRIHGICQCSPLIPHQGIFKPIKRINIFGTGQWQRRDWSHGKCWQIFCPISTHPWNPINHWKYLTRFLWPLSTFLFNPWLLNQYYIFILYNNASHWFSPHLSGIYICYILGICLVATDKTFNQIIC